jgi:tRNA (cmo5U34)-methyltransferase
MRAVASYGRGMQYSDSMSKLDAQAAAAPANRDLLMQANDAFDVVAYFNGEIAERYDQGIRLSCPSYDALHQSLGALLGQPAPGARHLSAGTGTGEELLTLGARDASWRFVGVDASADMLRVCRQRMDAAGLAGRVELFHGRLEDYECGPEFDSASSIFVAHFLRTREEKRAYLRAIADRLKPGARFVLADLYGDRHSKEFAILFEAWLVHYVSHGIPEEKLRSDLDHILRNFSFAPASELMAMLDEAGFTDIAHFYQNFLFGGWVARKRP